MKICILSIVNVKHMSAASMYIDYFAEKGIKFDVIYVDKYFKPEKISADNIYRYELKINRDWNKLKKINQYLSFRKYAKSILKKNKYDLVITWGTETAFLFFDFLLHNMEKKYIINIRDYANLNQKMKFKLLEILVKQSLFTTISSNGFKSFLPKANYFLIHSINKGILKKATKRNELVSTNSPIKICFLGYVRFFENDKKLIDALGNDKRFILQFFGVGSEVLEKYAKEKDIKNIEFLHSFDVEDTPLLLNKADVINNLYGYNDISLDTAVSIKYYYAVYLKLPIMVYKDTYMEKVSEGISFVFDGNYKNLADNLYQWYRSINFVSFKNKNQDLLKEMEAENQIFYSMLDRVLESDYQ